MIEPSPEQQRVIDLGVDTIRVRAGAGTGKTTTIAMAVAGLVKDRGVDPERILGITFTNKAAAELSDRIRESLTAIVEEGREVEVHTYHGFAAQVLGEFAPLAGLDRAVRIITPTFSRQLLGERFYHTEYSHLDLTSPSVIDRIRKLGERLGDHLLEPGDIAPVGPDADPVEASRAEMLATLERYTMDKRGLGVVDYGDLVTMSTRLMQGHPILAAEVRNRYEIVVLDEYQDTNPAQRVLLTTIFGDGFPVIAVGDEDQTIYEWRGASAENFESFLHHFRRKGVSTHDLGLTTNRRSAPEILAVANEVRRIANPGCDLLEPDGRIPVGKVITYWGTDALGEAAWIASKLEELHDDGKPWRDMAVLFRKNKDFAVVVDAMRRADIPVEVANLGGLLSVPEVSELKAWLTILDRPGDSAAAIQILTGSRYRLGLADLAAITGWIQEHGAVDVVEDAEEIRGISLLEGLEHLDDIPLREDAKTAMRHFQAIYRELLIESQGVSLVEACRLVLDRTNAWQDMDSLPQNQRLTARLNVYRVLDLAEEWTPLGGRPSIGAFLDYLIAMEEEPAEELDSAHLSGEDAVTLVTVHRAKGLEWDVVVVPAVVDKSFPGRAVQLPDPARFAEHLPARYRIDHLLDELPEDQRGRDDFFRERNALQEWRIAYVAVTRARETLIVTGAYWYGLPEPRKTPGEPSQLFELVAAYAEIDIRATDGAPPRPEVLRFEEEAEAPDPLFATGWAETIRSETAGEQPIEETARQLGVVESFDVEVSRLTDRLFSLAVLGPTPEPEARQVLSVTGLVTYAQCPKRYFWSDVDPLPRRRNPSAVAGTELHRRIELFHRGQVPFDEMEADLYDADAPDEATGGGFTAFKESRFATEGPLLVEAPFEMTLRNGYLLRGRIDAVYARGDHWEVVDFKSGRPKGDDARLVQLEAYALATREGDLGHSPPATLDVTFAYLGGGLTEETHRADDEWVARAAGHIDDLAGQIDAGSFEPTPGPWCASCDFLQFCEAGQRQMAT